MIKPFSMLLLLFCALNVQNVRALETPTEDFTDNKDGTVTHKKTGLLWQRCVIGQTWNGKTCTGLYSRLTWTEAMKFQGNGRVPRIDELNSIAEHARTAPAFNATIFPNNPASKYWTSSIYQSTDPNSKWNADNAAWVVDFGYGHDDYDYRIENLSKAVYERRFAVRLVSGGTSLPETGEFTPESDFIDHYNGTVTHKKTGLMWQKCAYGQMLVGNSRCSNTEIYLKHKNANSKDYFAGYDDWRLPTINELSSIVEYKNADPAINLAVFPDTPSYGFWSSSSLAVGGALDAWYVNFTYGGVGRYEYKGVNMAVRFVRGGFNYSADPQTSVDLNAAISVSPNPILAKDNLIYTGTITNNGAIAATNVTLTFSITQLMMKTAKVLPSGCLNRGISVVCKMGNLAAGASVTQTINALMLKKGALNLRVTAKAKETELNSIDNEAVTRLTIN